MPLCVITLTSNGDGTDEVDALRWWNILLFKLTVSLSYIGGIFESAGSDLWYSSNPENADLKVMKQCVFNTKFPD